MHWQAYYGDNSTFGSHDGSPWVAPARNVQVIIQEDPDHGWYTQSGGDYYVWDDRGDGPRWWGVDIFGLFDYLIDPGHKRVLFGRTVTGQRFGEIFAKAQADPEWGKKAAFRRGERRP